MFFKLNLSLTNCPNYKNLLRYNRLFLFRPMLLKLSNQISLPVVK